MTTREESFGQSWQLTPIDRLGIALGTAAVRRRVDVTGKTVADLGCGFRASLARGLAPTAASVHAVDLSLDPTLDAVPGIVPVVGALPAVIDDLVPASFDVVLCMSVVEHLDDPQGTLAGIRRLVAPGGVAVISVPTWWGKRWLELSAFRLGLSPFEEMEDHRTYYDPRDLWPMLVKAGFRPSWIRCRRFKLGMNTLAVCRIPLPEEGRTP